LTLSRISSLIDNVFTILLVLILIWAFLFCFFWSIELGCLVVSFIFGSKITCCRFVWILIRLMQFVICIVGFGEEITLIFLCVIEECFSLRVSWSFRIQILLHIVLSITLRVVGHQRKGCSIRCARHCLIKRMAKLTLFRVFTRS